MNVKFQNTMSRYQSSYYMVRYGRQDQSLLVGMYPKPYIFGIYLEYYNFRLFGCDFSLYHVHAVAVD